MSTMSQVTLTSGSFEEPSQVYSSQDLQTISAHEYELNQSDSIDFAFNLMTDSAANLTTNEIMVIFNAFQERESNLPFSINDTNDTDIQGLRWPGGMPAGLRRKFDQDRVRVGNSFGQERKGWFHNLPNSREGVRKSLNLLKYTTQTDFFEFNKFYSKLKLNITHFQLRNLVCCGPNLAKGIYYPSIYFRDNQLQVSSNDVFRQHDIDPDMYHQFFKINRLSPDTTTLSKRREPMKLDCIIDSHSLKKNCNSRISTLACTDDLLVCGTFEGGYVLYDTSEIGESPKLIGEHNIANKFDGITNHVVINEHHNGGSELCIASNDHHIRLVDVSRSSSAIPQVKQTYELPFAVNCIALNKSNPNELLITGDNVNSYIIDTREYKGGDKFTSTLKGHKDFGFSCDWTPKNGDLLLTGNQDGSVKLWDRRMLSEDADTSCLYSWDSSLGRDFLQESNIAGATTSSSSSAASSRSGSISSERSSSVNSASIRGGPVRNTKFSHNGDYICWAESLDHIGIIPTQELTQGAAKDGQLNRIQSIDFIGKCTGLNFAPVDNGHGEELIIGVSDNPLGGILSYRLDSKSKSLDFDFHF